MIVRTVSEIEAHLATIELSTKRAIESLAALTSPADALRQMKFGKTGRHPIEDRALNVVEQINQTFSYLVALNAAKWLLEVHPDAGGFSLAPGAHAAQRLDIMSIEPDLVGGEAFAATSPGSNRKLDKDLKRLTYALPLGTMAARLGGDEFAILVTGEGSHNARQLAERVVAAIAAPFQVAGCPAAIGASVGVAFASSGEGIDSLLHRADEELYRAKRSGGGMVRVAKTEDSAAA